MPRLEPNSGGTDSRGVIVPRGTLMHVGGLPFRTRRDTEVDGTEENLAMGLDAVKGFKEVQAFAHLLESASGPHMLSQMVLSEKWSDEARAAAAAARRAKSKGGNWRKAAWQTYATAKGEAKLGGKGRAGTKGQGFDKWAERRAEIKADERSGSSRRMASFMDRHEAIVNTRKQGILDRMRGRSTGASRASFDQMMDAPMKYSKRTGRTYSGKKAGFTRGSLARGRRADY